MISEIDKFEYVTEELINKAHKEMHRNYNK